MTVPREPDRLEIQIDGARDLRVTLVGELDLANIALLEAELAPVLEAPPKSLVFDLAGLDFMDSSGIAVMLRAAALVPTLRIENASQMIRRILDVTGLSEVLRVQS